MERSKRFCPVCFSVSAAPLPALSHPEWNTVKCTDCTMVYLDEAPDYASLSEEMAWTKQFSKEKKRRREKEPIVAWLDAKTRWRLHMFRDDEWAYIAGQVSAGHVLDVGCGQVDNVPAHFTPYGIEIEKQAASISDKLMRRRGGYVIHAPALDGLRQFEDEQFDGIIMRSYLEHEARPRDVLRTCRDKLKPGGVIYVKVPNFDTINRLVRGIDWCGFRFPDHLNYFGVRTLRELAKLEDFQFSIKNKLTRYTNDNMHCFLRKPHEAIRQPSA